MSEIVKISPEIDPVKLDKATEAHKEILARTIITANNLLELGKLFKTIRDEKLYKLLGAETFGEYVGYPEISFGRSTVYSFIHIYELYILKLGFGSKVLSNIGHRKLQIITPIVNSHVASALEIDEWITMARLLSESDLINEVRRVQGKPEMIPKPKEEKDVYPFSFEDYLSFVKAHGCITCGSGESDPHHFPKSKGAGGREYARIPLCRKCHSLYHQDPFDFLWLYKDDIFEYFYEMFLKCFEVLRINKE